MVLYEKYIKRGRGKIGVYLALILIAFLAWTFLFTHTSKAVSCYLVYPVVGDTADATELVKTDDADFDYLRKAFDAKFIWFDSPSCGFSEQYAVKFVFADGSSRSFRIAMDACPNYMIADMRMISLGDIDNDKTRAIRDKYRDRIAGEIRRI